MAILNFTLSEEGVSAFRDALICLNKFSDYVSLEARKESFVLTTLNSSKSAYASFKFATTRFFSRYQYQGSAQFRERFYCTLHIRALISLFRSRTAVDPQRDIDRQTLIEKCEISLEDGEGVKSRFVARIAFRHGLTSTHHLPFEVTVPVRAKFNKQDAPHHWKISSRTLRQLMDHFGPGIDYLDINTDGDHVNFTCYSEKTVSDDAVLKKPLQTSISVEVDEFDDIDVEDKLHIVMSVKDFRAIIQHAGITGNDLTACYSLPAQPIQLAYAGDAISCEFLIMTVGERGSTTGQKTSKKGRGKGGQNETPKLDAASRNTSMAPEARHQPSPERPAQPKVPPPALTSQMNAARASASRLGAFDLRPSQRPPPPATNMSESLFVEDDGWAPVQDEDEEEDARLEWDHSAPAPSINPDRRSFQRQVSFPVDPATGTTLRPNGQTQDMPATFLEPTQKLSDVRDLALFPD